MTDFSAWGYKTSITITGSTNGDKEDYPVFITIPYQSFMRSDFGDIRFTLQDGTELKYVLKSYTASSTADFIVKIPSLPASPTVTTIIIYAGNSSVTTTSDPSSVYDYDYTFPTSGSISPFTIAWGSVAQSNGYMRLRSVANSNQGMAYVSTNYITGQWDFNFFQESTGTQYAEFVFISQSNSYGSVTSNSYCVQIRQDTKKICLYKNGDGGTNLGSYTYTPDTTTHHITITRDQNGQMKVYLDGTLIITATDTSITTVSYLWCVGWAGSGTTYADFNNITHLPYTANPPTTGTLGNWTQTKCIISAPPIQSILTVNTPQIALGGGVRIIAPSIGLISSINIPTSRAIISSPPAKEVLTAIPPIIAFLMEVKAGVTYNPDAINVLKEDGIFVNISFNIMIGDQQYE